MQTASHPRLLRSIWKRLTAPRWPDGEPLLTAGGQRYGTRTESGSIILAPGFDFTPLRKQQAEGSEHQQQEADAIQDHADRPVVTRP